MNAATPGQAAYEVWRSAVPEFVCNVPAGPWDELSPAIRVGFEAIAAREPHAAPELAVVDLHRWYAVITQPDGSSKVIGHTDDGLGYYDSVDEWEAANS